MNNEQTLTLLRMDKRRQVDALRECGIRGLDYECKASLFPMMIRWAAGLLDVNVATFKKSDGTKVYFSLAEWLAMPETGAGSHAEYVKRGVRVRACGISFIIACINNASETAAWSGSTAALQLPMVSDTSDYRPMFKDEDGRNAAELMYASLNGTTANSVTGSPAANAVLNYKACTEADDGIDDTTVWGMMMPIHAKIIYRFFDQINEVIGRVWSNSFTIANANYWTGVQCNASNAWYLSMTGGNFYFQTKTNTYRVRPIAND